ncbi:MAG TPA: sigma-70 family RNA polymerase sigma factor [Flavobacteriales bacterium]|nr:sigma-70 family RNA polymerase sigma factor [Flavobacteriales bacterium]
MFYILLPTCVILGVKDIHSIWANPNPVNKQKELYKQDGLTNSAFVAELYKQYGKKLYAYALRNWNVSDDQAWDLVYKTLYRVIDTYKNYSFENEEKFGAFIFKIFINYLRNHYRDNKTKNENLKVSDVSPDQMYNKASEINNDLPSDPKLVALTEELEKMEDWQRMLLLMRSEGRSYSEIAKYIDKPEEQLKVYYQRLKESITKKMYERL